MLCIHKFTYENKGTKKYYKQTISIKCRSAFLHDVYIFWHYYYGDIIICNILYCSRLK